jgi:GNAT superfamily N-acetyltransferase
LSSLEELAEDIETLLPVPADVVRVDEPDCVLLHQPGFSFPPAGSVFRVRFALDAVEERVTAIRAWFAAHERPEFVWWIGTSATPADVQARLLAGGAEPYGDDPTVTSMVSTEEPPSVDGIDVRRVETLEDFRVAREIAWLAADFTGQQLAEARANVEQRWAERERRGNEVRFLAYVDGKPVASGDMALLPFAGFLSGASTHPDYRGRGAFRALVRARWDEAARRGTPALVVGAGKMSGPILERIGFRAVAEQHLLLDRSGFST